MASGCPLSTVVALDVDQIAKGFRLLLVLVMVIVMTAAAAATTVMIIIVIVITLAIAIIVARTLVTVLSMNDFLAVRPAAVPCFLTAVILETSAVVKKISQMNN